MPTYPSDAYHPVIGFNGESFDTLERVIDALRGYSAELTLENGDVIDAVILQSLYDEENNRVVIEFYRVRNGFVPTSIPLDQLERAFVRRIQII